MVVVVVVVVIVVVVVMVVVDKEGQTTRGHDNIHDDMNMYVIMHDQCLFIAMINSFHT